VRIVALKLRGRNLGMILLIGKAHRALYLGHRVDEAAQWIAGQRVVVAALVHKFELAKRAIVALGIAAAEQEALDLVGSVAGNSLLLVQLLSIGLQARAHIGREWRAILLKHI